MSDTANKLVAAAAQLIARVGYNGFSYADLAQQFGISKPSIHHHFPTKVDLAVAVVEQARRGIRTQIAALDHGSPVAMEQLQGYTGYWERCIKDQTAPFCLAAILAAELPSLPAPLVASVRGHFVDLTEWLSRVLALGVKQGTMRLEAPIEIEAERFMASVYGAMLAARAFDDPKRFATLAAAAVSSIRA